MKLNFCFYENAWELFLRQKNMKTFLIRLFQFHMKKMAKLIKIRALQF